MTFSKLQASSVKSNKQSAIGAQQGTNGGVTRPVTVTYSSNSRRNDGTLEISNLDQSTLVKYTRSRLSAN